MLETLLTLEILVKVDTNKAMGVDRINVKFFIMQRNLLEPNLTF